MTIKNKNKKTKLYKGMVLGTAGLLCLGCAPVQAFVAMADYLGDTPHTIGSEAILINGAEDSVVRGQKYEIKNAYFGTKTDKLKLGLEDTAYDTILGDNTFGDGSVTITDITSDINVYYSTGKVETIEVNTDVLSKPEVFGTFTADKAGEYTVKYAITVTYNGSVTKTYETEVNVESISEKAYLGFEQDAVVMPKIYDKALAKSGETYKDIELAIPTVYEDKEHETEVAIDDVLLPNELPAAGKKTVKITVSSTGAGTIILEENAGKVLIKGSDLKDVANGSNLVVRYSYYYGTEFVSSIEKKITVYDNYYADGTGKSTYELTLKRSGEHSAVTGVAGKLPTITGYAGADSTEEVAISLTTEVYLKTASGYVPKTGLIKDGKFTPDVDGSYKIVFKGEDFYGKKAETTILVDGVKDTQKPEVFMYDASDDANVREAANKDDIKFVNCEDKLKTKTACGNIIIYAIGATDNVSMPNDMTYKRTIKSSTRTIETRGYAKYNLIFDYDFSTLFKNSDLDPVNAARSNALYKQISADFAVSGKDIENENDVKEWLKDNNYLLVTHTPKTDYTEAQYVSEGLAFVDAENYQDLDFVLSGSSSGISYTVSYEATDASNNVSTKRSYTISIVSEDSNVFADNDAPTFSNEPAFKKNYSKKDKIKFTLPTASDTDIYLNKNLSYKYLSADKTQSSEPLTFEKDVYEIDLSEIDGLGLGFVPAHVEINYTVTDDYGNSNTWTKTANIIEITDNEKPELIRENYNTSSSNNIQNQEIVLPRIQYVDDGVSFITSDVKVFHIDGTKKTEISSYGKKETAVTNRPVKTFTLDAGAFVASYQGQYEAVVTIKDYSGNYIVTYYYYDVDGATVVNGASVSSSLAKSTTIETGASLTLPQPTVSYTKGSQYLVYGIGENNVATDYDVEIVNGKNNNGGKIFGDKESFIGTNYSAYTYELQYKINVMFYKEGFGFTADENGVKINIGAKTYYVLTRLSNEAAHDGAYVLVSYGALGVDNIIYGNVVGEAITFYDLGLTNGIHDGLSFDADETKKTGKLTFLSTGNEKANYFVADRVEAGALKFKGFGTYEGTVPDITLSRTHAIVNASSAALTTDDMMFETIIEGPYYVTVKDTTKPTITGNYDYPVVAEKGATINLKPIEATDNAKIEGLYSGIDSEKSYVEIAFSGRNGKGSQTSTSAQYYMNKWAAKDPSDPAKYVYEGKYNVTTGNIDYKLSETYNGTYTITYKVYDLAGNVATSTYSIAVGDTISPELKLSSDLLNKATYNVGDTVIVYSKGITVSDNNTETTQEDLLDSMVVKITSPDKEETKLTAGPSGSYEFKIDKVGTYKIQISVTDAAGWTTTQTREIVVEAQSVVPQTVSTAVGVVLVVAAVLILGGVVTYFVVSKVKLDKELKKRK